MTMALADAGAQPDGIAACGIACQRNSDFVWDARTGLPLANTITWQDLRTLPLLDGSKHCHFRPKCAIVLVIPLHRTCRHSILRGVCGTIEVVRAAAQAGTCVSDSQPCG